MSAYIQEHNSRIKEIHSLEASYFINFYICALKYLNRRQIMIQSCSSPPPNVAPVAVTLWRLLYGSHKAASTDAYYRPLYGQGRAGSSAAMMPDSNPLPGPDLAFLGQFTLVLAFKLAQV